MIKGQCHCGKVKFSINCELKELRRCNCSHCRRKGYVMTTVNKDEFHLESGEDYLSIYQWNTKIAKHFFCKICGINTHNKRRTNPNAFGVNVGCLDGFDMSWIKMFLILQMDKSSHLKIKSKEKLHYRKNKILKF